MSREARTHQQSGIVEERIAHLEKELQRLRNERAALASPYQKSGIAYQSLDSQGCLIEVNDAWLRIFGYEKAEVVGRSLADFLPEELQQQFREFFPQARALGEVLGERFPVRKKDGSIGIVTVNGWLERDAAGNYLRSHCLVQDITRQKELEDKREAERELLAICHQSPDLKTLMSNLAQFFQRLSGCEAIGIRLQADGDYPYYQTLGLPDAFIKLENSLCSRDENGSILLDFSGSPVLDCMCGNIIRGRFDPRLPFFTEFGSFWTNSTTQLLASTSAADRQARTRNRCNGWGYESVALIPIRNQQTIHGLFQFNDHRPNRFSAERIEQFEHLVSYVSLSLAKHLTEIARQENQQNLEAILNAAPESIQLLDRKGRTILANQATARRLKTTLPELQGKVIYDFFPPEIAAARKKLIDQVIATGEPLLCQDIRDGMAFDSYLWPVIAPDGEVARIAVFAVDSSEREIARKKLEESHQLLKNLATMVPGVVYQYRLYPDGRSAFPYSSPGMYTIYEVTPEEVREDATPVFGRLHPEDHDRVAAEIFHSAKTLETFFCEFRVILPIQGLRWRWSQAQPQRLDDGSTLWHGIISDITDRKLAEEKLRESNAYLENLINYANVPIIVWDMDYRITRFNHAFEELTGRSTVEMIGQSIGLLFPPEELPAAMALVRRTTAGEQWQHLGINIQHANGEIRHLLWNSARIMGADNTTPIALIAQGYDVTEQKRAEEESNRLAMQLQQAHKMEAIGTLAGGIAHDFNNILGGILGYAEMVQEDLPRDSAIAQDVGQILNAANRAKELVKQILAFSRQAATDRIPVQPALIIKEAVKLLRASLPSTITIVHDIDPECGMVLADPTQLHQIVVNLATNALHAMEQSGGTLTFRLRRHRAEAGGPGEGDGRQPTDTIHLSVTDTGCGIPSDIITRIFDPYFTTKEVGKGTGMGLAMVHGIIQSYNGSITCDSRLGEGTTFDIILPATGERMPRESPAIAPIAKGHEHLLLVDDEDILAQLGKTMLTRLGYQVTACNSSLTALATFQQRPEEFDLVITDQTMPGITGIDLARRLLRIRPELPIILCTGFSNIVSEETAKSHGIRGFCLKPLTKKEISQKIRELLDS